MKGAFVRKKRPCRICRKWFLADPRLKGRQMTCGASSCKREWHRRKCVQWNRANPEYFRANYLQKKLDAAASDPEALKGPLRSGLPCEQVQEVIGLQALIIVEYFTGLLLRRFQEVIRVQLPVNIEQLGPQPSWVCSRGDGP